MSIQSRSFIEEDVTSYSEDSYSSFQNNKNDDENGLSANELKTKLFHSIKNKGILDSLKSQLRNKLILELNSNTNQILPRNLAKDSLSIVENKKQRSNLALNTINSLILNHLKTHEYEYTLSVFMPECGIQINDAYTLNDIFQILKISNESKIYKDLNDTNVIKSKGLLWYLVNHLCSNYVTKSIETQTDDNLFGRALTTLDYKLKHLEQHYSDRYHELNLTNGHNVEEKLHAYQKRLEEKAKADLEQRIKEFKENEIKLLQIEERDRFKAELVRAKEDLDKIYQQRYEALNEKERNIDEIIRHRRTIEEKEIFLQRQTILEDLASLRERENEFKRSSEAQNQKLEVELIRVKQLEDDMRKREFQLKLLEEDYETRLKNEKEKIRFDMERNFSQREFIVQSIERKNHEETKRLDEERAHLDKLKTDVQQKGFRINELEIELQRCRSQCVALMNENTNYKEKLQQYLNYEIIKEENNYLKSQLENIKIHLGESFLKKRNLDVLVSKKRTVTFSEQEPVEQAKENNQIETLHDLGDKILFAADESLALKSRIEEQTSANRELRDLCEMQLLESRKLQDEVSDIKTHVKFLQNGIAIPDESEIQAADFSRKQIKPPNQPYESNLANESTAFIERAKERLKNLEFEAEKIEKNYRDYQYKMKTISYPINDDSKSMSSNLQTSFDVKDFLQKTLKKVDKPQESNDKILKSLYDEVESFNKHESIKSQLVSLKKESLIQPFTKPNESEIISTSNDLSTRIVNQPYKVQQTKYSSSESSLSESVKDARQNAPLDLSRFTTSPEPEKKSAKVSISEKIEQKINIGEETDRDSPSMKNNFETRKPIKYNFEFETESEEEEGAKLSIGDQEKDSKDYENNEDDDDFNY